ncbi:MAG: hypothetical protein K5756_05080 [Clostridiales bacterium]|nr:hypothetical protein [Clostridiales bacterium]
MQLYKNAELKMFEIWLSKKEKEDIDKKGKLNRLFELCNEFGYRPVVYVSGNSDLMSGTTEILCRKAKENPTASA